MPLIKDGQVITDTWQMVADDGALPNTGDLIVTLSRWQADRKELLARGGKLGLHVPNTTQVADIADDLAIFSLIAVEFPVFRDGRAFSQARLLRERYHFYGEIRAIGDVLRDQLQFMSRCGINAYQLRPDQNVEDCLRTFSEIRINYQPWIH